MGCRTSASVMTSACVMVVMSLALTAQQATRPHTAFQPGARVHLHAHNCYPDHGRWADRLPRALAAGARHLAIEQDLVWVPPGPEGPGRSVVAHDVPARGDEPTLEEHFFHAVRPIMERALAEGRRETWPVLVLHLDFKTNEPEHHGAVWSLLGNYEAWLTTARKRQPGNPPSPLEAGPLLVLTEHGEGQERDFHDLRPFGSVLRLFGSVPPARIDVSDEAAGRPATMARLAPEQLIPSGATSYRRWTNHSWAVVEEGGPPAAGPWSPADNARLHAIVARAHEQGLWVRFYGLNGHAPNGRGWSRSYNFGSRLAVEPRWRAAAAARADFIATDQYEDFVESEK